MAISARNQLNATVKSIKTGAVNDQIELQLSDDETLVAVITADSTKRLGLKIGSPVVALFKAPAVILSTDTDLILSARNQLTATVVSVTEGAVNAEVVVNVLIKASHILLGVKK